LINHSAQKEVLQEDTLDNIYTSSNAIAREPLWQTVSHKHKNLPRTLKQWLLDPSSLTKKLIDYSTGQLRVEVIEQSIRRARFSEYKALKLAHHKYVVVREVVLYGQEIPLVYARTIMPLSTLKGPLRKLYYLGNRPLGGALFADPSMRRGELEVAPIGQHYLPKRTLNSFSKNLNSSCQPAAFHHNPHHNCWGRRSLFFLKNKPLLVCEIFLPSLVDQ
jgi:chorismate--pyruvate lyase